MSFKLAWTRLPELSQRTAVAIQGALLYLPDLVRPSRALLDFRPFHLSLHSACSGLLAFVRHAVAFVPLSF